MKRVLVVDDQREMAETLADGLAERGWVATAASGAEALARIEEPFDALVTDLRMPDVDGLHLLARSREVAPERPVIVMTAYSALDTAIESIRLGAYHYVTKPFKTEELALFLDRADEEARVRREARALARTLRERFSLANVVGDSAAMRGVLEIIERVATANAPVLVTGETGTGKGLVARALHTESERRSAAFVTVNCAALPDSLLESELFGHVKGAFTGATSTRGGLFVEADHGTIFLDEIGEMSAALQAKLLHVLEGGVVRAVGASKERTVDVRVVAATHRDLKERVRAGAFREDLYYRLDVVTIELPALRHRSEDVPLLVEHFLRAARARHPKASVRRISAPALARLIDYAWPGNVRELEHAIERIVLLGKDEEASLADLPPAIASPAPPEAPPIFTDVIPVRELQRRYAAWALDKLGGHKTRTAERLGIDLKTLSKWLTQDER